MKNIKTQLKGLGLTYSFIDKKMKKNIYLIALVFVYGSSIGQTLSDKAKYELDSLTTEQEAISLKDLGCKLFDNVRDDSVRIFFAGENFIQKKNNDFSLSIFRYLNNKKGVNSFVMETPYSVKYMFDSWVKNKEEIFFYGKVNGLKNYNSIKYKELFKELYIEKVENNKSFNLHSIDIEYDLLQAINCIGVIMGRHPSKVEKVKEIEEKVDYAHIVDYDIKYQESLVVELSELLNSDKSYFKILFKDDYIYFKKIIEGMMRKLEFDRIMLKDGEIIAGNYREKILYENLKEILELEPESKFYAQIGAIHLLDNVLLEKVKRLWGINTLESLSNLIKKDNIKTYKIWYWYDKITVTFYYPNNAKYLSNISDSSKGKINIINLEKCQSLFPELSLEFDKIIITKY